MDGPFAVLLLSRQSSNILRVNASGWSCIPNHTLGMDLRDFQRQFSLSVLFAPGAGFGNEPTSLYNMVPLQSKGHFRLKSSEVIPLRLWQSPELPDEA